MAVPFSNTKLRVPKGFQSLLEGFAREVLRHQPTNIYEFGAQYFDKVLKEREAGGEDPAKVGAEEEDRFYNNHSFKDPNQDVNDSQLDESAVKIQAAFRGHVDRKRVNAIKDEKQVAEQSQADKAEEAEAQQQQQQQQQQAPEEAPEEAPLKAATPPPIAEEAQVDATLSEDDAATAIQSSIRGHRARKDLKSNTEDDQPQQEQPQEEQPTEQTENAEQDVLSGELSDAATAIQSGFRGYQARKLVKAQQQEAGNEDRAPSQQRGEEQQEAPAEETEAEVPSQDPPSVHVEDVDEGVVADVEAPAGDEVDAVPQTAETAEVETEVNRDTAAEEPPVAEAEDGVAQVTIEESKEERGSPVAGVAHDEVDSAAPADIIEAEPAVEEQKEAEEEQPAEPAAEALEEKPEEQTEQIVEAAAQELTTDEPMEAAPEGEAAVEEAAPAAEDAAPVAEDAAPAEEEATTVAEDAAPAVEDAPAVEETAPVAEEPTPAAEEVAPAAEDAAPAAEDAAPVAEDTAPAAEAAPAPDANPED